MRRWLPFGLALVLALAGIIALMLGVYACDAREPTDFGPYAIVSRVDGQTMYFDLVRAGNVELTLAGSLDTLCDPPFVARFDVNDDGVADLYFRNCRGHGYVVRRADTITYAGQGDTAEPTSWWAHQVLGGGMRLIVLGIALCLSALIAVAIAGAVMRPVRARSDS